MSKGQSIMDLRIYSVDIDCPTPSKGAVLRFSIGTPVQPETPWNHNTTPILPEDLQPAHICAAGEVVEVDAYQVNHEPAVWSIRVRLKPAWIHPNEWMLEVVPRVMPQMASRILYAIRQRLTSP